MTPHTGIALDQAQIVGDLMACVRFVRSINGQLHRWAGQKTAEVRTVKGSHLDLELAI